MRANRCGNLLAALVDRQVCWKRWPWQPLTTLGTRRSRLLKTHAKLFRQLPQSTHLRLRFTQNSVEGGTVTTENEI
jgi:hypothetical protein